MISENTNRNKFESAALMLGTAGFILMLAGCCCNVYLLILSVIADIAAIAVALISRDTTGSKLSRTAKKAIVLASWALFFSIGFALFYSSVIHNEELMAQVYEIYESMGYDFTLP